MDFATSNFVNFAFLSECFSSAINENNLGRENRQ